MTETQLRFLRSISERLPAEQIAELHVFPPLKQGGVETGVAVVAGPPALPERVVVYSAHYRLTLKGPDRGRWEVEVTEEADAPLLTVDEVVRGVQRRAGEGQDPERVSGDRLRELLA